MAKATVGLLHPGEMGAAIGAALRAVGTRVLWTSDARSEATGRRPDDAGLEDVTLDELTHQSDVILSVCPPHAAAEVAESVGDFGGIYVDANAISPATVRTIRAKRLVDGGIIGPPPHGSGTTRLYLSGGEAEPVAELFAATTVDARVLSEESGDASALKMTYAAWTKGTAALLLAIRAAAEAEGVEAALTEEWQLSLPELPATLERARRSAEAKGWRWIAEMEEIAATFAADGQPDGFHLAVAEMYRRYPR
jgi:3-hydroxyisobutyrate dehydrogenase-like beta-hydroxyacid dehydrogenase